MRNRSGMIKNDVFDHFQEFPLHPDNFSHFYGYAVAVKGVFLDTLQKETFSRKMTKIDFCHPQAPENDKKSDLPFQGFLAPHGGNKLW